MDFSLPDGTGVDATKKVLRLHPLCKIIFLTISDDDDDLFTAIRSGAKGYLLKSIHPTKLVAAVRAVQQGESALSGSMTLRLMQEFARTKPIEMKNAVMVEKLTQREVEVLRMVATGITNQEIATQLFLSENTVKYHMHTILGKLNLPDRRAAASYAKESGLIS